MHLPSFVSDLTLPPLEYQRQMRAWCKEMRATSPVAYDEDHAVWIVFRHSDVVRVLGDYATFSSAQLLKSKDGIAIEGNTPSIIAMDPPRHQQLRALVTQAFSARTIAAMSPQVSAITEELVNNVLSAGEMDWMADIAVPLPVIVIADMLGLPRDGWRQYKAWTDALINRSPDLPEAIQQFHGLFAQAIESRQQQPQDDILSRLLVSEVEGQRLSYQDVIGFCYTLFVAGNITTTNVLGNAMLCFDAFPEALARLREHPELVPSAVEEILRYMPPFRAGPSDLVAGRTATTTVTLGDQRIAVGDRVQVNHVSANFDEQQFPDPERFDIGRSPNRHLSFGHGIHFCLGAPLARLEIATVLHALLQRFRSVRVVHEVPLEQSPSMTIFGPKRVPLVFQVA